MICQVYHVIGLPVRTNEYIADPTTERYRQCLFEWLATHALQWNQLTYRRQAYFSTDGDVWDVEYNDATTTTPRCWVQPRASKSLARTARRGGVTSGCSSRIPTNQVLFGLIAELQSTLPDDRYTGKRIQRVYDERGRKRDHSRDAATKYTADRLRERNVDTVYVGNLTDVLATH